MAKQTIQERAQRIIEAYDYLKANPVGGVSPNIVTLDLTNEIYIAQRALEIVEKHIEASNEG